MSAQEADAVRKLSEEGCVKMQTREEGVKKSEYFADVICTWPLTSNPQCVDPPGWVGARMGLRVLFTCYTLNENDAIQTDKNQFLAEFGLRLSPPSYSIFAVLLRTAMAEGRAMQIWTAIGVVTKFRLLFHLFCGIKGSRARRGRLHDHGVVCWQCAIEGGVIHSAATLKESNLSFQSPSPYSDSPIGYGRSMKVQ